MITIETLPNGLTIIVEEMPQVESAAIELHFGGGITHDPEGRIGASFVLAELVSRGAGPYDSKQLSDAFDSLGIRHGEAAGQEHMTFSCLCLKQNLETALNLINLMVQQPLMPEEELKPIKSILNQDIAAIKDNPSKWAMVEMAARYYPQPYSRTLLGAEAGLEELNIKDLKALQQNFFRAQGAVISVAGNVSASAVIKLATALFSNLEGSTPKSPNFGKVVSEKYYHVQHESAQTQIVVKSAACAFLDPHYYASRCLNMILSGGMFGRLFIEVREKRGLCYSVYAKYSSGKDYGVMTAYAGTTPDRAQSTLDVLVQELRSIRGTIKEEELNRAKVNIKAGLVLGEESCGSRAGSNASDFWLTARVRTIEEILDHVNSVSIDSIDSFLKAYPYDKISVLTLGPKKLDIIS